MDKDKDYETQNFLSLKSITKKVIDGNKTINKSLNNELDIGQDLNLSQVIQANKPTKLSSLSENKTENETNQNKENTFKLSKLLQNFNINKIFTTKSSKLAISVVILAIICIMFLNLSTTSKTPQNKKISTTYNALEYVSSKLYVENLEKRLVDVLSKIKGAGKVTVMVTLESGPELKIATSVDERTNTSTGSQGTTNTSVTVIENPILISQNGQSYPLVLMEIVPKIRGVVVVAEGAGNVKTKLELLEAVQSLLNLPQKNIQIYQGI